jgi:hypothetical protein
MAKLLINKKTHNLHITTNERELWETATLTITVKKSTVHEVFKKLGFWIMKLGLLIAGVGKVEFESENK